MLNIPKANKVKKLAEMCTVMSSSTHQLVPFRLNAEQEALVQALESGNNVCVLKARQMGISTILCLMDLLIAVINDGVHIGIVVHNQASATDLLGKVANFASCLGIPIVSQNTRRITLKNLSSISAITASGGSETSGSRVGRSQSFQWLHLSELAYWPNSDAYPALLAASGKNSPIVIESTANGKNNIFHSIWEGATYKNIFFGVEAHKEYSDDEDKISNTQWADMQKQLGFTSRRHASWWAQKLAITGGDEARHKKEYPILPEHPFESSSYRYIKTDTTVGTPTKTLLGDSISLWKEASKYKGHSIIAVDVSAGTGRDSSAVVVLDSTTQELLATWSDNEADFNTLTQVIKTLYNHYKPENSVIIEQNGVGHGLIVMLRNESIPIYSLVTTSISQQLGLQRTKMAIENKQLVIGPQRLFDEVQSLHINKADKFAGKKDMCMALGFAYNWLQNNMHEEPKAMTDTQLVYTSPRFRDNRGQIL